MPLPSPEVEAINRQTASLIPTALKMSAPPPTDTHCHTSSTPPPPPLHLVNGHVRPAVLLAEQLAVALAR